MAYGKATLLLVVLVMLGLAAVSDAQLRNRFYSGKCYGYNVEATVRRIVRDRFRRDPRVVAHLLRMLFHECAINGCDGGLLIDGPGAEKTSLANQSVQGYDLIADIKAELEWRCPGIVSCSDIQILATRDAVALAGGRRYRVRTGRRDRRRSWAGDVDLPGPDITVRTSTAYFAKLGLNQRDMVLLLGAHTVGITHCNFIKNSRLYGYGGIPGNTDPRIDPYAAFVYKTQLCPDTPLSDNNFLLLDEEWSAFKVDNNFYKMLRKGRGVLRIDQNLQSNRRTRPMVRMLANSDSRFSRMFPAALVKLGEVNVLTGGRGEIRRVCNRFNYY